MVDSSSSSGAAAIALAPAALYRESDLSGSHFETTDQLQPVDGLIGQMRALEAVAIGAKIEKKGFNLFVIGSGGAAIRDALKTVLARDAKARPHPSDWVYVNNFSRPDRPRRSSFRQDARSYSREPCTS